MQRLVFYSFLVIIALLVSCNNKSKFVEEIFTEVEAIVEQYPDSALCLLDSIQNPYELNENQFSQYILRYVQAKDKADRNISMDTLIFRARNYYKNHKDSKSQALVEFYCGRVFQSQGKYDLAMKSYLDTEKLADKMGNFYLSGMVDFYIGVLNYNQYLHEEAAIPYFKNANKKLVTLKNKYKYEIVICNYIANSYLLCQLIDSATVYYKKGLKIAEDNNDIEEKASINQNMSLAFLEIGDIKSSKTALNSALSYFAEHNTKQQAQIYLILANIYQQENKPDSALYYSNLSLKLAQNENTLKTSVYKFLSQLEESAGNIQKSLDYYRMYATQLSLDFDDDRSSHLLEIQRKYNYELIQNANKKLIIERLWILIGLTSAVVVTFFIYYRNRVRDKEALLLAKQQIYQLKEMVAEKDERKDEIVDNEINKKLRDTLFKQLDIIKKITLIEVHLNEKEKTNGRWLLNKVNEIIRKSNEEFDWSNFYQLVNVLYDDFLTHIMNAYPTLKEEEILVCCLSKIGLNTEEIGLLMRSNRNIVQKKKSSIRKKTGMKEKSGFLQQLNSISKGK